MHSECLSENARYLERALADNVFGARDAGPPLMDSMKHMQALVDELKQAADDRLALINELQGVAVARLRALETAQAQIQAQSTGAAKDP